MNCPYCSTSNPDGAKFCNECGRPLDPTVKRPDLPDPLNPAASASAAVPAAEAATASLPRVESLRSARSAASRARAYDEPAAGSYPEEPVEYAESEDPEAYPYAYDGEDLPYAVDIPDTHASNHDLYGQGLPEIYSDTQVLPREHVPSAADHWGIDATMKMAAVPGAEEEDKAEIFSAPDPSDAQGKGRSRKKGLIALLIVVLLAGAIAGITYYLELWGGIRVPDVVGLNESEAVNVLQEKGFSVRSMLVKSDDTEGKVILSDPKTGDRARKGGEVVIHVATPRTIPDVVGLNEQEAMRLFKEAGYENVTYEKVKSNEEEGKVLSVSPEAGTKVKGASPVTVTVAEAYTVPNVVGMDEQSAINAVQEAGYYVQVSYDYSESAPEGQVIATSPEANAKYPSESTVVITVIKSRAHELTDIMHGVLYDGATVYIGGTSYYVHSVESIEYAGNDVVNFSIVGQAFTVLDGETVYGSTKTVSGAAHFDSSNNYTMS